MKLPNWLRTKSTRRVAPDRVKVVLDFDATRFQEAMGKAAQASAILTNDLGATLRYRRRIAYQRDLGRAYVGTLLDGLCRDFQLDPAKVWRLPRLHEQLAKIGGARS